MCQNRLSLHTAGLPVCPKYVPCITMAQMEVFNTHSHPMWGRGWVCHLAITLSMHRSDDDDDQVFLTLIRISWLCQLPRCTACILVRMIRLQSLLQLNPRDRSADLPQHTTGITTTVTSQSLSLSLSSNTRGSISLTRPLRTACSMTPR